MAKVFLITGIKTTIIKKLFQRQIYRKFIFGVWQKTSHRRIPRNLIKTKPFFLPIFVQSKTFLDDVFMAVEQMWVDF